MATQMDFKNGCLSALGNYGTQAIHCKKNLIKTRKKRNKIYVKLYVKKYSLQVVTFIVSVYSESATYKEEKVKRT